MTDLYQSYVNTLRKLADVEYAIGVLSWDKEVYMPSKGASSRAQQLASLSGIAHEIFTDNVFEDVLNKLLDQEEFLKPEEFRNVKLTHRDFLKTKKLDKTFVMRLSLAVSKAYHAWLSAREANDFNIYQDSLDELIKIKREQAEVLGYKIHPYDALLDEFEPDCTTAELDVLFRDVKEQLIDFVAPFQQKHSFKNDFLFKHYPKDKQWDFSLYLLKEMGYDFEAGRQDVSPHPFTINFGPQDVRVTTRVDENNLATCLWSCIHEGGHALYEQGLAVDNYGLPTGRFLSLGIHESQSRLWENHVGRSMAYWQKHYPELQKRFPENLSGITLGDFYKGINKIEPSLIRIESDELHYHFHVLIRYEIEKELIEGSLEVADVKDSWNAKYKDFLDLEVPDDRQGVLQDIHWAHGSFGYFPTYSLGSFYAAQFYQAAVEQIPDLEKEIAIGNTLPLLKWLRKNIHQHGRRYSASELCEKVTGEKLNFKYFMKYSKEKFEGLY